MYLTCSAPEIMVHVISKLLHPVFFSVCDYVFKLCVSDAKNILNFPNLQNAGHFYLVLSQPTQPWNLQTLLTVPQ